MNRSWFGLARSRPGSAGGTGLTDEPANGVCPAPRTNRSAPDDLPRILTGFVLGGVLALAVVIGFALLMSVAAEPLARFDLAGLQTAGEMLLLLLPVVLVPSLPIVGAAVLARRDKVNAARQSFSHAISIAVLFAVVCGRPVGMALLTAIILCGLVGLGAVFFVAVVAQGREGATGHGAVRRPTR